MAIRNFATKYSFPNNKRTGVDKKVTLGRQRGEGFFIWLLQFSGRLFCLRFKRRKKGNILKPRSCGVTNLKKTSALRDWWYQRCLLVCLQRQLWNKEGDRWSRADETRERQQTKVGGRPVLTILNHQLLTTFSFKGFNMSCQVIALAVLMQYTSHAWFITFQLRICKALFLNSRVQLFYAG